MMPSRTMALAAGAVIIAAFGAGLALYGTARTGGNIGGKIGVPCAEAIARTSPLARGDVAAFQAGPAPRPAAALAFKGPDGADITLADLRGKLLLVNLWATWCAPCKAEMPALDRLQAALGGADFAVVAINVETRNLDKPPAWLKENGIVNLAYHGDPAGRVLPAVQKQIGAIGLPTTFLVDAKGCEIGVMKGPAEWDGADGLALVRAALGRPS